MASLRRQIQQAGEFRHGVGRAGAYTRRQWHLAVAGRSRRARGRRRGQSVGLRLRARRQCGAQVRPGRRVAAAHRSARRGGRATTPHSSGQTRHPPPQHRHARGVRLRWLWQSPRDRLQFRHRRVHPHVGRLWQAALVARCRREFGNPVHKVERGPTAESMSPTESRTASRNSSSCRAVRDICGK